MLISSATGDDAPALRELHRQTWIATYAGLLPPAFFAERVAAHRARDWARLARDQVSAGGDVLVARTRTGLVGLCQYGPTEDSDDDPLQVGQIQRLYIHPTCQGQGIGRSLLGAAVQRLTKPGIRSLTLWALEADPRARGFYERMGWQLDGATRFDGASDVRYRLHADVPLA